MGGDMNHLTQISPEKRPRKDGSRAGGDTDATAAISTLSIVSPRGCSDNSNQDNSSTVDSNGQSDDLYIGAENGGAAGHNSVLKSKQPESRSDESGDSKPGEQSDGGDSPADTPRPQRLLLACGNGSAGQLGIKGAGTVRHPTESSSDVLNRGGDDLNEVLSVSVSSLHTLLVRADGVVWTTGSNEFGQLGRSGQSTRILRPLQSLTQRIVQVCAGDRFSFARSNTGRLFSWGLNDTGQLGQGHRDTLLKPRPVKNIPGNRPIQQVACGAQHVLAVSNAGELLVWGSARFGQLGNGTYASSSNPLLCKFLTNEGVQGIACGHGHCLVLTAKNSVYAWGLNNFGQLGLGDNTNRLRPAEVTPLRVPSLAGIVSGSFHCVAFTKSGLVFAWGQGHRGQLGVGTSAPRSQPRPAVIEALRGTKITAAAAGLAHTFFLSDRRRLYVCGDHSNGQLSLPDSSTTAGDSTSHKQLFMTPVRCPLELQPQHSHLIVDEVFCGGNSSFIYLTTEHGSEARRDLLLEGSGQQINMERMRRKLEAYVTTDPGQQQVTAVRKAILAGFSSISVLNECTTDNANAKRSTAGGNKYASNGSLAHNAGLRPDFATIRKVYELIDQAGASEPAIPRTLGRALTSLMDALATFKPAAPEDLVCYHALFECPLLLNHANTYYDVLDSVLRSLMKLSSPLRKLFVEGCENYGPTHASNALRCLQNVITESALRGNTGAQVWRAATLLAELRKYKQHFSREKLKPELFYNDTLSERTNLEEEFKRWATQGSSVFTVCQFPFLLNPEAKRRLLRAEAHQHMSAAAYGARLRQFQRLQEVLTTVVAQQSGAQDPPPPPDQDTNTSAAQSAPATDAAEDSRASAPAAGPRVVEVPLVESDLLVLKVRRKFLLNDTLRELTRVLEMDGLHRLAGRPISELRKPLVVHFEGEDGVDEGGLRKEFFQLLMKEILEPIHSSPADTSQDQRQHGFFRWCADSQRYWFWPEKRDPAGAEGWLRDTMTMLGTLFGLAAYNGILLNAPFPEFLYEMIIDEGVLGKKGLQQKLALLHQIYPSEASSLSTLLNLSDAELEEVEQTFQITVQTLREEATAGGKSPLVEKLIDLKPDAANIMVNGTNRKEFCDLYCTYLLEKSVAAQLQPFRAGFLQVVGGKVVSLCSAAELSLMVSGHPLSLSENGLRDLEAVTKYAGGYTAQSPTIRWFWQHVHSPKTSDEWRRRLLLFTTGTDRLPILGLRSLRFVIQRAGDDQNHLPVAHTCFNTLDLPEYATPAVLKERLAKALEHVTGFGLV